MPKQCKECTRPVFNAGFCKIHQSKRPDFKASVIKRAKEKKEAKKEKTQKAVKVKTLARLKKDLWEVFSEFIRLRDADANGYAKCFTCGNIRYWRDGDCGHGIPRQHQATFINEQNNHFQCKPCNGFEGGKREEYKAEMNRRYGPNTWDLMEWASRQPKKWTRFEIQHLTDHYKREADKLRAVKGDRKAA